MTTCRLELCQWWCDHSCHPLCCHPSPRIFPWKFHVIFSLVPWFPLYRKIKKAASNNVKSLMYITEIINKNKSTPIESSSSPMDWIDVRNFGPVWMETLRWFDYYCWAVWSPYSQPHHYLDKLPAVIVRPPKALSTSTYDECSRWVKGGAHLSYNLHINTVWGEA